MNLPRNITVKRVNTQMTDRKSEKDQEVTTGMVLKNLPKRRRSIRVTLKLKLMKRENIRKKIKTERNIPAHLTKKAEKRIEKVAQ